VRRAPGSEIAAEIPMITTNWSAVQVARDAYCGLVVPVRRCSAPMLSAMRWICAPRCREDVASTWPKGPSRQQAGCSLEPSAHGAE